MSEFIITGKPRGGKSFIAVKMVYDILRMEKDHRPIVTNLPLNLPVIAEELRIDLKMEKAPDLSQRIRILDDGETSEFWLFEPKHEFQHRKSLAFRKWKMDIPDMENRGERGCWYVIDEVHIPFPAQFGTRYEGQEELEADLRWFITQHGKMNIDIILITQHPEQINKALRRMAQEYLHVRNLSREPYLGFRIGNLFRYVRSLNSPASANPAAFDSGFHPMDFKKFGKMYDTTKGVGIVGTFIHEQPQRGRPLWVLIFPIIAFFAFLYWLVFYAPKETTRMANRISGAATKHLENQTGMVLNGTNKPSPFAFRQTPQAKVNHDDATYTPQNKNETNEVYCRGYTILSGVAYVQLSNGENYNSIDREVEAIKLHSVTINGKTYNIKRQEPTFKEPKPIDQSKNAVTMPVNSQKIVIDNPVDAAILDSRLSKVNENNN